MKNFISYYERCRNVQRLPMSFKHRSYNLLEHQYLVGMLFMRIAKLEGIPYSIEELDVILNHDVIESHTQDLSYEVKNFSLKTKVAWETIEDEVASKFEDLSPYTDKAIKETLNSVQFDLFKCCDLLDLLIFLKKEQEIGNKDRHIVEITDRCKALIYGKFKTIDDIIDTYE